MVQYWANSSDACKRKDSWNIWKLFYKNIDELFSSALYNLCVYKHDAP